MEIFEQGSDEWFQQRCGKVTASRFSDVMSAGRGKNPSLTRLKYLRQVVAEQLTGKPSETYSNHHMERGTIQEPFARMAYEERSGKDVDEVGFIEYPENELIGGSPDGLVGADSGVEIKSVIPTVQIETLLAGICPPQHLPQIQGLMMIKGAKTWDFVSYSPDMPEPMDLFIFTVQRDPVYINELYGGIMQFLADVDEMKAKLFNKKAD